MNTSFRIRRQSGSSLVTTLLVIVVLTIIVTAFLQSMTMERQTSRSYMNRYRAELAADAASRLAMNRIRTFMQEHPYHASGIQKDPFAGTTSARFPILTGWVDTMPKSTTPLDISYLTSTADPKIAPDPTKLNDTNSIDVNVPTSGTDTSGWIGSPVVVDAAGTSTQTRLEHRAPWINILADPTKTEQPDPKLSNYNPVVSRFAYWVEDETMKVDAAVVGNDKKGGGFERSKSGAYLSDLDLGALPLKDKKPLPETEKSINANILNARKQNPDRPIDLGVLGQFTGPDDKPSNYKFHATTFSLSEELAGNGRRRANLNHIVDVSSSETNALDPKVIQGDIDDIGYVISGRHLFSDASSQSSQAVFANAPDDLTGPLPDFGKRFYTTPDIKASTAVSPDPAKVTHEDIYLLRIAANIRDYIDKDSMPTVIDISKNIVSKTRPDFAWGGPNPPPPLALGKEAIPYFQEHVWNFQLKDVQITGDKSRNVSFEVYQYYEFYNPSTTDFTAPPQTTLKVYNLPKFDAGSGPSVELEDLEMNLSGQNFPAGKAVVVTNCTDPSMDPPDLIKPDSAVIRVSTPSNTYTFDNNPGDKQVGSGTGDDRRFGIRLAGRQSADTDYGTEMLFSTPDGYLDAHPFVAIPAITAFPVEMTLSKNKKSGTFALTGDDLKKRLVWGSSLRGNDSPARSRSGDPRTLSEPMELVAGTNTLYGNDQGRFFLSYNGNGDIKGSKATVGEPKTDYVDPTNWPDYHVKLSNSKANGYAVIRNGEMFSIGELGNVFDPHRKITAGQDGASKTDLNETKINRARGGGRTLKIGQPDDLLVPTRFGDGSPSAVAWNNAAWRLTDYFSAEPQQVVMSEPVKRGKLNINGVLRDGGVAFRAALRSFEYLPAPEGDLRTPQKLSTADIDELLRQLQEYLKKNGPMMERGELSQLDFFYNVNNKSAAQPGQSTAFDRGREELFRRVVELITTRSASYSVYAIGQAVRQKSNGDIDVLSTILQRDVFWLNPILESSPNGATPSVEAKTESYDYYPVYHIAR